MDKPEWEFYTGSWYWLIHTKCGAWIWSNWCECREKVPDHIVLQAQMLEDGDGFKTYEIPEYRINENP